MSRIHRQKPTDATRTRHTPADLSPTFTEAAQICQRYRLLIRSAGDIHYRTLAEAQRVAAIHTPHTPVITRAEFNADNSHYRGHQAGYRITTIIDEGPCGHDICARCAPPKPAPKPKTSNLRTNAQNRAMHALAAKNGLTHDDLRDLAGEVTNGKTDHTSELTFKQANEVIHRLGGQPLPEYGGKVSRRTEQYRRQKAGITAQKMIASDVQLAHIQKLAAQRGITDEGLERLAERMKVNYPPHTRAGAIALIEALKAMIARDKKEAA